MLAQVAMGNGANPHGFHVKLYLFIHKKRAIRRV